MSEKYATIQQRVSYGIGRQMGDQLADNPFDGIDANAVAEGVVDALNGTASPIEPALLEAAFNEIHQQIQAKVLPRKIADLVVDRRPWPVKNSTG